jgi:hypothetical protein
MGQFERPPSENVRRANSSVKVTNVGGMKPLIPILCSFQVGVEGQLWGQNFLAQYNSCWLHAAAWSRQDSDDLVTPTKKVPC